MFKFNLLFLLTVEMIITIVGYYTKDTFGILNKNITDTIYLFWIFNLLLASFFAGILSPINFAIYRIAFRVSGFFSEFSIELHVFSLHTPLQRLTFSTPLDSWWSRFTLLDIFSLSLFTLPTEFQISRWVQTKTKRIFNNFFIKWTVQIFH